MHHVIIVIEHPVSLNSPDVGIARIGRQARCGREKYTVVPFLPKFFDSSDVDFKTMS